MGNRSCAAIIGDGMILMVRQTYKGETFWTFPGGTIEAGETPLQCAVRETKEETGLDIRIAAKVCEQYSEKINGTYHCFLGNITGGTPRLGCDPELDADRQELTDLRWFPVAEMREHPEVKRVLAFLQKTGDRG